MRLDLDYVTAAQYALGTGETNITSEQDSPTDFEFYADEERTVRRHVVVRLSNPDTASATEDVTLTIESVFGVDTQQVDTETQSVTLAAGNTVTTQFLSSPEVVSAGAYRVSISTSGTTLTVDQAEVYTRDIQYAWELGPNGTSRVIDHDGRTRLETPALSPGVRVPGGVIDQQGTRVARFDGAGLEVDSSGEVPTLQTGTRAETVTVDGDGTTTVSIPHSLGTTPTAVSVTPASADARGDFHRSGLSSSAVELTYASAPPSGTGNLTYDLLVAGDSA